ncbi:MAG TPA: copper resistance protein CopC [Longimicrobiaceae bacterium]|nr:copper resistance protein CopC [Longimicrobiaceae bacterium]
MRRERRSFGRATRAVALVLALLGAWTGVAAPAHAHGVLRRSNPAEGARLATVPRELRLTFSERVELALARLQLIGPDLAPVALGPLRLAADSSQVLVAGIRGGLVAGTYTVAWQVAGADGHPVRGRYSFVIAPGARGLVGPSAPGRAPPPSARYDRASVSTESGFDAESPLYIAVRWLTFVGILGVIGAATFRFAVLPLVRKRGTPPGVAVLDTATAGAARLGLLAAGVVMGAAVPRLLAQSAALHGGRGPLDAGLIATMLTRTVWGWGWWLQCVGGLLALAGFVLARKRGRRAVETRTGWMLVAVGATVLAFSPALSGHAASVRTGMALAVLADGIHVLGAGGWLGGLLFVVAAGIPAAMRLEEGTRGRAVAALVDAFSPTALVFAGLVAATGVITAGLHLGSIPALWQSAYGRTLLLKLAVLSTVFGTGGYNWLRVRPGLGHGSGMERLRRTATVELAVGALVLAVTAVLVATATPSVAGGR